MPESKRILGTNGSLGYIGERFEVFRNGMAFFPKREDPDPGVVIFIRGDNPRMDRMQCNCIASATKTCRHIKEFSKVYKGLKGGLASRQF